MVSKWNSQIINRKLLVRFTKESSFINNGNQMSYTIGELFASAKINGSPLVTRGYTILIQPVIFRFFQL